MPLARLRDQGMCTLVITPRGAPMGDVIELGEGTSHEIEAMTTV